AGGLNSSFLWWTTPVMRKRRDVFDSTDFQSCILQVQDSLLAACTGAFYLHFHFQHAVFARLGGGLFGGATGGKRRALARALEPDRPRRRPGDRLTIGVGDRHHRVVERRPDVCHAARHALAKLFLWT